MFEKIPKQEYKDLKRNFATRTSVEKYSVHSPQRQNVFRVFTILNLMNMKKILGICVLSVVAVVCLRVRGENDEDCKEAHEQRGFCLLKHKYKEIQADSLSQCYMNCARESSCHSINFFSGATKKCEMNTATRAARPEDYTSCANSIHMDNVVRSMMLVYRYTEPFQSLI